jgi:histidine triad (HIT) family protein
MNECIFCKIAAGEIPARFVFRDDETGVMAIEDVNPQAPAHLLVMPIAHHATLAAAVGRREADATVRRMFEVASALGTERGGESGFRLVVNTGPDGGQTVDHVHLHVLAGRAMTWPPG